MNELNDTNTPNDLNALNAMDPMNSMNALNAMPFALCPLRDVVLPSLRAGGLYPPACKPLRAGSGDGVYDPRPILYLLVY